MHIRGDGHFCPNAFSARVAPTIPPKISLNAWDRGIGVAVNFRSINRLTYYKTHFDLPDGTFPNAERIGDSTITLPLYTKLTDSEIDYVIAHKWFNLAAMHGNKDAVRLRREIAAEMSAQEIAAAQRAARDWLHTGAVTRTAA